MKKKYDKMINLLTSKCAEIQGVKIAVFGLTNKSVEQYLNSACFLKNDGY